MGYFPNACRFVTTGGKSYSFELIWETPDRFHCQHRESGWVALIDYRGESPLPSDCSLPGVDAENLRHLKKELCDLPLRVLRQQADEALKDVDPEQAAFWAFYDSLPDA